MRTIKREIGDHGEEQARRYLAKKGYRIVASNYTTRSGEIDIVAMQRNILVFVEVKTRKNDHFCSAREAVTKSKQGKIFLTAKEFVAENKIDYKEIRFDVIEYYTQTQTIEHYVDAFG
ncbi:MAG: YraN family protein [Peptostreptococcaceae bacterium]|nr:YraN family protein [Peptostreptococcaceae bacterium]